MRPFAIALLALAGLAGLPIFCAAFAQEPQVVDGIAAIVNGEVITSSPAFTPNAIIAMSNALVPFATQIQCFAPT